MFNQNPASGTPDPNSGVPLIEDEDKELDEGPANRVPGAPAATPLMTDLLNKQAACYKAAVALFRKTAAIRPVKHQPSAMKVTAVGEGDYSGLKTKPWTLQGEDAFKDITPHK